MNENRHLAYDSRCKDLFLILSQKERYIFHQEEVWKAVILFLIRYSCLYDKKHYILAHIFF